MRDTNNIIIEVEFSNYLSLKQKYTKSELLTAIHKIRTDVNAAKTKLALG